MIAIAVWLIVIGAFLCDEDSMRSTTGDGLIVLGLLVLAAYVVVSP